MRRFFIQVYHFAPPNAKKRALGQGSLSALRVCILLGGVLLERIKIGIDDALRTTVHQLVVSGVVAGVQVFNGTVDVRHTKNALHTGGVIILAFHHDARRQRRPVLVIGIDGQIRHLLNGFRRFGAFHGAGDHHGAKPGCMIRSHNLIAVQEPVIASNGKLALQIPSGASISQVYDPQSVLAKHTMGATAFNAQIKGEPGHHTFFVYTHQGEMDWWQPVNIYIENTRKAPSYTDFADIRPEKCRMVDFDRQLNASVTDIYQNEYLSPRSPYTTLQLPTQGIGEWCHPLLTATIDDSELRSLVHHDTFQTSLGIPFRLKEKGNNILFTSLWDNYPDSSTISLSGTASHAYLLMAGSTNHMQCHIANGIIRIHYADGTSQATELTNPDNWCPIEQDFYVDGKAFQVPAPRPYRLHLKSGKVSRDLGKELNITGVYGREIEGGAGILLDIPLDDSKELKGLTLETLSNDVVIGIMGITLQ